MRGYQGGNRRMCLITPLQGPNNTVQRIEVMRTMCEVMVSVKRGSVDLWYGEFSGDRPLVPHMHFGQSNSPVWVPIPYGIYVITVRLEDLVSSDNILACLMLGGGLGDE